MSELWLIVGGAGLAAGFAAQMARWLRVLQREHYEPAAPPRFWRRWTWLRWTGPTRGGGLTMGGSGPRAQASSSEVVATPGRRRMVSLSLLVLVTFPVALAVSLATRNAAPFCVDTILYGLACPWHLRPRGRTGALRWTRRLSTVATLAVIPDLVLVAVGALVHRVMLGAALAVWAVPLVISLAARALEPYETARAGRFVASARARLARVHPVVVAITGSYGKTSTKNHLADLLSGDGGVVATPKSFNNRAGLSRAINENLTDDTRVFIAEMGTYGPGEIRELCTWCVPEIAVITAIGPVHLERMKSLDVIEAAKFEITERARVVIVNVDDARLAQWPERLGERRVRRAGSTNPEADVRVVVAEGLWQVWVDGVELAQMEPVAGMQPTNVACALAAALEVGALPAEVAKRLRSLRSVEHRAALTTAPSGVVVVDDTFNANPASARAALNVLTGLDIAVRRVVVTPGLIELGVDQHSRNEALARDVAALGLELAVVGRTNSSALFEGYGQPARFFRVRDDAVAWVRKALTVGDAVLYLNDLPDHYP